jgi:hypothetical protein
MAAIARPQPTFWIDRNPRPALRLVPPPVRRRRSEAVYRRRRAIALLVLVSGLALGALWLGGGPLTASGPAAAKPALAAASSDGTYVVQPGDTLWALVRRVQPRGDIRPIVHQLSTARQGAPLRAGERIVLP